MQKSKGFTIVELLIVIVVVGILAALVVTTFNSVMGKGDGQPQYVIFTSDGSRYRTDHYEEKDGCVLFDSWGGSNKVCGSYTVRQY